MAEPTPPKHAKPTKGTAQRLLAMLQVQAEAAGTKAVALSLLAADYTGKINAARRHFGGEEVAARLALTAEQRVAERALPAQDRPAVTKSG